MKRILLAAAATVAVVGAAAARDGGRDVYPVDPLTTQGVYNAQSAPNVDRMTTASIGTAPQDSSAAALIEASKESIRHGHR